MGHFKLALPHRAEARSVIGLAGLLVFLTLAADNAEAAKKSVDGLFPDLRTVVPQQLQLVNSHQRELLRFSNGVANTGDGPWQMRPVFPNPGTLGTQDAVQEILNANGDVVLEKVVSQFEFHPEHNHWHIEGVALFEIRVGSLSGPIFGASSRKTAFCLIDWYKLDGNSPQTERIFGECGVDRPQGVSPGWVDQYNQAVEGQQLDLTGAPPGRYYLISTANPDGQFLEQNLSNNTAWVTFELSRDSSGNPKIDVVDHSPCESPGLCGEQAPNR